MRIILIHRYFWPDTPLYAHLLRDVAVRLGDGGHDVTVLTCQPSYNRDVVSRAARREQIAPSVDVHRWPVLPDRRFAVLKAVNLVIFCSRLMFARRLLGNADVVMAASTPPIALAKTGRFVARSAGARFIYHKQDVYPEVVTAPGILKSGRWADLLRRIDTHTDRGSDRIVVLSEDMADTVVARGIKEDRIVVINNFDPWTEEDSLAPTSALADLVSDPGDPARRALQVVFAGNLGRFQNLDKLLAAADMLKDQRDIVIHLFGVGSLHDQIKREVSDNGLRQVRVHGHRAPAEVAQFLSTVADIGVVSLMPGVIGAAYPSKTMTYLRHGCPVLVLAEAHSALARTIKSAGAGFQADPTDPGAIAAALRRLASQRSLLDGVGDRAAELYRAQFSREHALVAWESLFDAMQQLGPR